VRTPIGLNVGANHAALGADHPAAMVLLISQPSHHLWISDAAMINMITTSVDCQN
jgi:hypothetical protein